jgi:hypothetical protein
MPTAVVSFYMDNIQIELVAAQRAVVEKFLPEGFTFLQILTAIGHPESLDNFIATSAYDVIIFLDIDCVPINSVALLFLESEATRSKLIGCAQRANHIDNNQHVYVGPFCCALNRTLWNDLGRPSFLPTSRGDVGEELTFACEETGKPFELLWPSSVEEPLWQLSEDREFGFGTEYDGLFWHLFAGRRQSAKERFVRKCEKILISPPSNTSQLARFSRRHFSRALVVCARWETECIAEWLCYHRHIGFDHVYLYCNDDDPSELYEAVLPFIGENGFVDFFHFGLQGYQREMYFHFLTNYATECDWFMFLDVDEFIVLKRHNKIGEFLDSFEIQPDAIYFFWRLAGNNGHVTRPIGAVVPQYTRCEAQINPFTKVLIRTKGLAENMLQTAAVVGQAFWHDIEPLMSESSAISDVLGNDLRFWYKNDWPHEALRIVSKPEYNSRISDTAFIFHISIKSENDFMRRYERGTGGQFYGQAGWREFHEKGRSEMLRYLARFDEIEESRLVDVRSAIMNGAFINQIVAAAPGKNIALDGIASQSSIGAWSRSQDIETDAGGIINGKPSGSYQHHTNIEREPWWQVDLGTSRPIKQIRLFNRIDGVRDRLRNVVVKGSLDGLEWFTIFTKLDDTPFGGIDGYPHIWNPDHNWVSRYVRVCGVGVSLLDFDQVEIY